MVKMKPVLPSMRERKRYIGFEVVAEKPLRDDDVRRAIREAVHNYIGDLGMARAGMEVMELNDNKGIISASREGVDMVKASLALIHIIGGGKAIIKSMTTSGMLNKARKKTYGG